MRTWRAAVPLVLLPLATLSGCWGENAISPADEQALVEAIEKQVPGISVESTNPSGNGIATGYRFQVSAETPTRDWTVARRQAREVSRVAWREADVRSANIEVILKLTALSEPDCDDVTDDVTCESVIVEIPTDAARRLWGDNEEGNRDDSTDGETFVPQASDGLPKGWEPTLLGAFEPNLYYAVFVPGDIGDAKLQKGVDDLAKFLWREHPDRLESVRIQAYFRRPSTSSPTKQAPEPSVTTSASTSSRTVPPIRSTVVTYSAAELRGKFGPRAADLER